MIRSRIERIRPHLGPLLLLLAAVLAVYARILGHDFIFSWDDQQYVTGNSAIQGISLPHLRELFTSCYAGNYAPVQMLSYMADHAVWGLKAGGFLFTNILIHGANGLLFYRLLLRLHADRRFALVGAALFLLHPVQVESVAWVSQRKNLLAMFFFLIAWEGYCRYREAGTGKGRRAYAGSLAAFVAALLAKPAAVILPPVLLLLDRAFSPAERRSRLADKVPFVVAAGVVAVVALSTQQGEHGGGRVEFHGGSPLATFLTMLPVLCRYLGMLVWPVGLSAVYAPVIHRSPDAMVAAAAVLLIAVGLIGWRLWQHDRRLGFWLLVFFVSLLPVSQLVPLVTLMNDRYLYFPMLGAAALGGAAASFLLDRAGAGRRTPAVAVIVLPLLVLALVSFQRAAVWRDPLTLWTDAVERSPNASYAWSSLAEVYFRDLRVDEALRAYERSLEIDPGNRMAIAALGPIYTELGELDRGRAMLTQFLRMRPDDVKATAYLGIIHQRRGEFAEAEQMFERALAIQPDSRRVLFLLGDQALEQRRFDRARGYFMRAETLQGNDPETALRLACTASLAGRADEALGWLEQAFRRGYRDYDALYREEQLAALWNDPRFTYLLRRYFPDGGDGP